MKAVQGAGLDVLERRAGLGGALEEWAGRTLPLPSAFDSAQADEVRERLKALGYSGKGD